MGWRHSSVSDTRYCSPPQLDDIVEGKLHNSGVGRTHYIEEMGSECLGTVPDDLRNEFNSIDKDCTLDNNNTLPWQQRLPGPSSVTFARAKSCPSTPKWQLNGPLTEICRDRSSNYCSKPAEEATDLLRGRSMV